MGAKIKLFWSYAFLFIGSLSCSDSDILHQKAFELSEQGWDQDFKLEDSWEVSQDWDHPSLVLKVNFSTEFNYQNLYLTANLEKNNLPVLSDTISIQLANPGRGEEWLGTKQGEMVSVSDTIPIPAVWQNGDEMKVEITQFSREKRLEGIRGMEVTILR